MIQIHTPVGEVVERLEAALKKYSSHTDVGRVGFLLMMNF